MQKNTWIKIIFAIGILIRLIPYLFNRSLWFDEAMLANNIVQLSFSELAGPLQYGQIAPIGFLYLEKLSILLLGNSEYALRLFPCIIGIFALYLFYLVLKHFFDDRFILLAFAFGALCNSQIYYSSEVKQYIFDVFATLLISKLTIDILNHDTSKKELLKWGITGSTLVWFSQPVIFVLTISSCCIVYYLYKNQYEKLSLALGSSLFWVTSFAIYYFIFLAPAIAKDSLQSFHQVYFMPLDFWQPESLQWYWNSYFGLFRNPGNILFKYPAGVIALIGICFGFKKNKTLLFLFIAPLLLAIGASAFGKYSTIPRLLLFATPILFILVTKGIEIIYHFLKQQKNGDQLKYIALAIAGLLILQPILNTIQQTVNPKKIEEIKIPLSYIEQHRKKEDILYVYHYAIPQFDYYKNKYDIQQMNTIKGISPYEDWQAQLDLLSSNTRVWLLFSHDQRDGGWDAENFTNYFQKKAQLIDKKKDEGSSCFLYQIN